MPSKPGAQTKVDFAPWMPAPYVEADVMALKALQDGSATKEQQQRALRWVVEICARTYDQPFRPGGAEGGRETDFACGRQAVGKEIVKLLNMDVSKLRRNPNG